MVRVWVGVTVRARVRVSARVRVRVWVRVRVRLESPPRWPQVAACADACPCQWA